MPYTTQEELTDRFGERLMLQLTDRAGAGASDPAIIVRALADTDAVIDAYVGGRYQLPFAVTPPVLADLAQAIAVYKLFTSKPSEKIQADYDGALRALQQIATGVMTLPVAGVPAAAAPAAGVEFVDRPRVFGTSMPGFI